MLTEMFLKVNGLMIKLTEKEYIYIEMGLRIKEIGLKINNMGLD